MVSRYAKLTRLSGVQVNRKTFVTDYGVPYRDLRILDPLVSHARGSCCSLVDWLTVLTDNAPAMMSFCSCSYQLCSQRRCL